jgi:enoyl-CoA hydratase/carnithine racemase
MTYENLLYEQKGAVGFITINRPKVLNALNSATMRELDDALSNAGRDSAVRALILTGAGEKAFVAGADINELARCTATDGRELALFGQGVFAKLENAGHAFDRRDQRICAGGGLRIGAGVHDQIGQPRCAIWAARSHSGIDSRDTGVRSAWRGSAAKARRTNCAWRGKRFRLRRRCASDL